MSKFLKTKYLASLALSLGLLLTVDQPALAGDDCSKPVPEVSKDAADEKVVNRPNLDEVFDMKSTTETPKADSLNVDDEVLKTAMAVYKGPRRMRSDVYNKPTRDYYIKPCRDYYRHAVLNHRTMPGFQDKTLGAALRAFDEKIAASSSNGIIRQINWTNTKLSRTNSDQQALDEEVEACLLKQLSHTTSSRSNSDQRSVGATIDEKIEACLEISLKDGKASK